MAYGKITIVCLKTAAISAVGNYGWASRLYWSML